MHRYYVWNQRVSLKFEVQTGRSESGQSLIKLDRSNQGSKSRKISCLFVHEKNRIRFDRAIFIVISNPGSKSQRTVHFLPPGLSNRYIDSKDRSL